MLRSALPHGCLVINNIRLKMRFFELVPSFLRRRILSMILSCQGVSHVILVLLEFLENTPTLNLSLENKKNKQKKKHYLLASQNVIGLLKVDICFNKDPYFQIPVLLDYINVLIFRLYSVLLCFSCIMRENKSVTCLEGLFVMVHQGKM